MLLFHVFFLPTVSQQNTTNRFLCDSISFFGTKFLTRVLHIYQLVFFGKIKENQVKNFQISGTAK